MRIAMYKTMINKGMSCDFIKVTFVELRSKSGQCQW